MSYGSGARGVASGGQRDQPSVLHTHVLHTHDGVAHERPVGTRSGPGDTSVDVGSLPRALGVMCVRAGTLPAAQALASGALSAFVWGALSAGDPPFRRAGGCERRGRVRSGIARRAAAHYLHAQTRANTIMANARGPFYVATVYREQLPRWVCVRACFVVAGTICTCVSRSRGD